MLGLYVAFFVVGFLFVSFSAVYAYLLVKYALQPKTTKNSSPSARLRLYAQEQEMMSLHTSESTPTSERDNAIASSPTEPYTLVNAPGTAGEVAENEWTSPAQEKIETSLPATETPLVEPKGSPFSSQLLKFWSTVTGLVRKAFAGGMKRLRDSTDDPRQAGLGPTRQQETRDVPSREENNSLFSWAVQCLVHFKCGGRNPGVD